MTQAFNENAVDRNYLDQMRDLVLHVTSNVDCTVFLFGSRASGVHRKNSDIDIGFIARVVDDIGGHGARYFAKRGKIALA